MPRVSRTFIKAGMAWFFLSLIAGLLQEMDVALLPALSPLFWHLLMVGWITQIIMGVSIWMFPGRTREEGLKAQKWPWLAFGLLNCGLFLRLIGEPMVGLSAGVFWKIVLVVSALLQLLGAAAYLIEMWPRILSKKQQRKKRKEQRS